MYIAITIRVRGRLKNTPLLRIVREVRRSIPPRYFDIDPEGLWFTRGSGVQTVPEMYHTARNICHEPYRIHSLHTLLVCVPYYVSAFGSPSLKSVVYRHVCVYPVRGAM